MMHPHTFIKQVSKHIGLGVFASQDIPKGTIIYVKDEFEIEVTPDQYKSMSPDIRYSVEKYSYIDAAGNRVLSWDHGKYVNHCCFANTMTTGYGFEVAIRDIKEGEQITDDYGLFNLEYDMPLMCKTKGCRKVVRSADFDKNVPYWDSQVQEALQRFKDVAQPMLSVLPKHELADLAGYLDQALPYKSVARQQHQPPSTHAPCEHAHHIHEALHVVALH